MLFLMLDCLQVTMIERVFWDLCGSPIFVNFVQPLDDIFKLQFKVLLGNQFHFSKCVGPTLNHLQLFC